MYSRVGTADWVPDVCTEEEFKSRIATVLDGACVWIDPPVKRALVKRLKAIPLEEQTTQRVLLECDQVKLTAPKKKDLLVDRLAEILVDQGIDATVVKRVKNLVKSDPDIAGCVAK